jgi:hypothetical protein
VRRWRRWALGLGARALELAAAIRDVLRSKDEIVPLAESFRRFFLKDLAARPMRSRRHPLARARISRPSFDGPMKN